MKKRKLKVPKRRNPIANAAKKRKASIVPNKKKNKDYGMAGDQPSTKNPNYNDQDTWGY